MLGGVGGGGCVGRGGGGVRGRGGQGGCERRIKVFVKKHFFFWGGGDRVDGGGGGQGGCERRIEVFVKIKKKQTFLGGWGGGVQVWGRGQVKLDVNEELKFL